MHICTDLVHDKYNIFCYNDKKDLVTITGFMWREGDINMAFPKQIKDVIYNLLQEPTLDNLREFLKSETGEHNAIDFKSEWIDADKLAKIMLAMANCGGGIILIGVVENEDGTVQCEGVETLRDKADISNDIKKYITTDLHYEVYDFVYNTSEYAALEGRNYQMMVIDDTPEHIPFMAKKRGNNIKDNVVYIRRGTSSEEANQEEIRALINRRINYMNPLTGEPLRLEEHLSQLKLLYNSIEREKVYYKNAVGTGMLSALKSIISSVMISGERVVEDNPLYPDENYDEFVSRMISQKKKKIERVLDLY